jgi:hypothetical protein
MKKTNITLNDVRDEAMTTIQELKNGTLDIAKAKEIKGLLDTIIQTGKSQVDFISSLPKQIRDGLTIDQVLEFAVAYKNEEAELDKTLTEIDKKNKEPYKLSDRF